MLVKKKKKLKIIEAKYLDFVIKQPIDVDRPLNKNTQPKIFMLLSMFLKETFSEIIDYFMKKPYYISADSNRALCKSKATSIF